MRFCAPIDPAPRLAVLGVLTTDGHLDYRAAIRSSWMRKSEAADITTRFVMRGLGSAAEDEARLHGDIVFVEALAGASRKNGPLQSLVLWWRCAVESWPQASLVGKADDDIWVQMTATAAHLRGSMAALAAQPSFAQDRRPPAMYWGIMETFHWNSVKARPVGFAKKYGGGRARTECFRRHLHANGSLVRPEARSERSDDAWRSTSGRGHLIGPFNFAKGARHSGRSAPSAAVSCVALTIVPMPRRSDVFRLARARGAAERRRGPPTPRQRYCALSQRFARGAVPAMGGCLHGHGARPISFGRRPGIGASAHGPLRGRLAVCVDAERAAVAHENQEPAPNRRCGALVIAAAAVRAKRGGAHLWQHLHLVQRWYMATLHVHAQQDDLRNEAGAP